VAAREVSSEDLVARLSSHPDARAIESFDAALRAVADGAQPGDIVVTMGAGDVTGLSDRLVAELGR